MRFNLLFHRPVRRQRSGLSTTLAALAMSLALSICSESASAASSAVGTITLNLTLIDLDQSDGIASAISFLPVGEGSTVDADGHVSSYTFASKANVSIFQDGIKTAGQRDYSESALSSLASSAAWGADNAGVAMSTALSSSSISFSLIAKSATEGVTVISLYQIMSQFMLTAHTAVVVTASLSGALVGDAGLYGGVSLYDESGVNGGEISLTLNNTDPAFNSTGGTLRLSNTSDAVLSGIFQVMEVADASVAVSSVPEPQSAWLVGAGLVVVAGGRTRRRRG